MKNSPPERRGRSGPQARPGPGKRESAAAPGLAIRQAAHRIILDVTLGHRPLDEAFGTLTGDFSPRDRAFVRRLATTSLRRFGQADALIATLLDKGPLPAKESALRTLLVMASVELLFLATPPHAAIDTAVRLAQSIPALAGRGGLVNALLRRLSREVQDEAAAAARAPVTCNVPDWLLRRWTQHYGKAAAEEFAAVHAAEPPLDFTVKGDEDWTERLGATRLPTGSLRRAAGGLIGDLPGFADGAWWIQDAAAALPARLLGDVKGRTVLDLCAAPGGKTAQLAASGAHVTALDRDAGRLARLESNLKRLGLAARFVCADILTFKPEAAVSHILLDAPCTATGTLRRHPDLPWLKRETDIAAAAEQQAAFLDAAAGMLAPGGMLVYAVCSLEPEEGEAQIMALLNRSKALRPFPLNPDEISGTTAFITPEGYLRTTPSAWPELGGLDGFFAARLMRSTS